VSRESRKPRRLLPNSFTVLVLAHDIRFGIFAAIVLAAIRRILRGELRAIMRWTRFATAYRIVVSGMEWGNSLKIRYERSRVFCGLAKPSGVLQRRMA
jgi:hypothetical protein